MTLGNRLKQCRKQAGVTQAEVARLIKMSQANLSDLENDRYPSSSFVPQLAAYFGVSALWLATGKGLKDKNKIDPRTEEMISLYLELPEETQASALELLRKMVKLQKK